MISKPTYDRLRKASLIKYGRLYNWPAAAHANIAPVGWSVPTEPNFTTLSNYITAEIAASRLPDVGVGNILKHRRQVNSPLGGEFATSTHPRWAEWATEYGRDSVLFGGLPAGKYQLNATFANIGGGLSCWSSTMYSSTRSWGSNLSYHLSNSSINTGDKTEGYSIRCFRLAATWEQALPDGTHRGQVQDIDGNIYDTVKIGTQVWMVQNLATTRLNDGTPITLVTSGAMSDSVANYANYDNDLTNVFFTSHLDSIWKPKDFVIPS